MVFYMHDQLMGAKPTALPVAMHKNVTALDFGTITVIDDVVTEGIERDSEQVGQAQGIYANSALDGTDIHLLFSIIFTNKKYNGSTLEIQGTERWTLKQREVSVVSGTGVFRFARGYANLETTYSSGLNAIGKFNATLLHY
ncbi:dirigent protein 1-like [Magnolia sinica]|uniref:dirigent protein 1-like n=1 Tax=Magnolia sinica TaxID=86752 RepID=UPI00265B5B6B|nr:dirigent protein 1-like [Magnolia sinica]